MYSLSPTGHRLLIERSRDRTMLPLDRISTSPMPLTAAYFSPLKSANAHVALSAATPFWSREDLSTLPTSNFPDPSSLIAKIVLLPCAGRGSHFSPTFLNNPRFDPA